MEKLKPSYVTNTIDALISGMYDRQHKKRLGMQEELLIVKKAFQTYIESQEEE